jgi:hypothetical protein
MENLYIIVCNCTSDIKGTNSILGMNPGLANIIIPTLITIFVFFSGLFFQFYFQKSKKKSELKSLKTMLILWIHKSIITINRQIIAYQKFTNNLSSLKIISNTTLAIDPFQLDKLQSINLEKLSNLIILNHIGDKQDKTYILFNITAQIEKLLNVEKQIIEKYSSLYSKTEECERNWRQHYSELNHFILLISVKKEKSTIQSEKMFYEKIEQINTLFKTRQIGVIDYINLLNDFCEKYKSENKPFQDYFEFSKILTELLLIFKIWKAFSDGVIAYFKTSEDVLISSLKIIKKETDALEKLKIKKWWKIN